MSKLKARIISLVNLFHSIKHENLKWQSDNQAQQANLKQKQVLAQAQLEEELKRRKVRLEHDIKLLKTQHKTELSMFKTKCQQDIKDYKHYLSSLDQLKESIQSSYTHLPEAVALTIHHHAKYLLHKMWETEDVDQKMHYELKLIKFMTTVHEDARLFLEGQTSSQLPSNTLQLIERR